MVSFLFYIVVNFAANTVASSGLAIVRLQIGSYEELERFISTSFSKDEIPEIAAGRPGEWYDLVVNGLQFEIIKKSGIAYQVIDEDLEKAKEKVKDGYRSYDQVVAILRNVSLSYPEIVKLDSIGPTFEGRWIYGVKISDNVQEDEEEPEVLFSGCHHAREWVSVEVPLFYVDTLTRAYGIDPVITDLVNNREIWIFPVINVDGYIYDYTGGTSGRYWRKNRELYSSSIGTDLNRNYNGTCDTNAIDGWGVINSSSVSHHPSSDVFCGRAGNSAPEVRSYVNFIKSRNFCIIVDYHTYSELVLAPWGHKYDPTPHDDIYNLLGQNMAQRIQRIGGGSYTYSKSIQLYPTSGGSSDYQYGWSIFVKGRPCFTLVVEMGTAFYQDTLDLPVIKRENFKGAHYLMQQAEYILNNMKAYIPKPEIIAPQADTVRDTLKIEWTIPNRGFYNLSGFEVEFFKGLHREVESFESNNELWIFEGFARSNRRSYSGNFSLRADSSNNLYSQARTKFPYPVSLGDSLNFRIYYDLETDYDAGIVEVSEDLREWIPISGERFTGSSGGFVLKAYNFEDFAGKAVYFRFRCMTDGSVLNDGMYIDDVYPVAKWDSVWTVPGVSDTFIVLSDLEEGEYYFRVAGISGDFGRGTYSNLKKVYIQRTSYVSEPVERSFVGLFDERNKVLNNKVIFRLNGKSVRLYIFDVQGRVVEELEYRNVKNKEVIISLPKSGVYFYMGVADSSKYTGKFLFIR
ncbi:MAG: M14 family zinc carboxypeptidase [candidate division WOR-3 bacterium]